MEGLSNGLVGSLRKAPAEFCRRLAFDSNEKEILTHAKPRKKKDIPE